MQIVSKVNKALMKCYENSFILQDVYILIKMISYTIYCYFEVLFRNLAPAAYLNKNIKGEVVCITGAGNFCDIDSHIISLNTSKTNV